MRYTSDLLCHFVGRSLKTDNERFDLLVKIIREKQLKVNLNNPDHPSASTDSQYKGENYGEVFRSADCVCFCDIPDDMLEIHTSKYSKFGMGFEKLFLSKQGARPVMYVPSGGVIKELSPTNSPKSCPMDYYIYLNNLSTSFIPIIILLNQNNPFKNQLNNILTKNKMLIDYVKLFDGQILKDFSANKTHQMLFGLTTALATQNVYVKVFDETLDENDINNYYMEREWRCLYSIDFNLEDIKRIYLPSEGFVVRFKDELPEYHGEFFILNS